MLAVDQKLLLSLLCQIIHTRPIRESEEFLKEYINKIIYMSSGHMILPLVLNGVYQTYPELAEKFKNRAVKRTIQQAEKSASFLLLYEKMLEHGLSPLVLKGIICRNLYPEPELRSSADEDLLIRPHEIYACHSFLIDHGFHLTDPDISLEKEYEISYQNSDSHLYIEVHKHLFPPYDQSYGYLNEIFDRPEEPATILVYGTAFRTLGYTDHFLYMLAHAYKHVIYSGIGIRQICDIALFIDSYREQIDWDRVTEVCKQYHLDQFVQAILLICEKYLGMQSVNISFTAKSVNEEPLLLDILSGGVYGANDENRLHSSTMTLKAISADKEGRKTNGIMKSVFPSLGYMKKSYPYLKKNPYLLPAAWVQRIYRYAFQSSSNVDAAKTLEIGRERIRMLKEYGIIQE